MKIVGDRMTACTLLAVVGFVQEFWGRNKIGEESQEGEMETSPSLNVLVQSAKSGCKVTVKSFIHHKDSLQIIKLLMEFKLHTRCQEMQRSKARFSVRS